MALFEKRILLCTGFHRSATSATANYLLNAGLNMGDDLVEAHISNAKGHFEDWPVVHLHDEQLSQHNTNWQFHDECVLSPAPDFLDAYIADRTQISSDWGVKDPRACLFLNEWQRALGKSGAFLFVIRHWSGSVESLLHRHSRELAYALPPLNADSAGFNFWTQPALAAKMWLSYNRRILDFARSNPEQSLIVTQRALFEGAPVIATLNSQFGFELNEEAESPFDPSLFRDQASSRIFSQLSHSLQAQLNAVWEQLLDLARFKSDNEQPIVIEDASAEPALAVIHQGLVTEALAPPYTQVAIKTSKRAFVSWLESLTRIADPITAADYLDKTSNGVMAMAEPSEWLPALDKKFFIDGPVLLAAAKLLVRLNQCHLAINYFQKAVSVGCYFPYVDMMLGQCYQTLGRFAAAEFFFNKAIAENPNNPLFYTSYAKLLVAMNNIAKAEEQFAMGYEKGRYQPSVVIPYIEFLEKRDPDKAMHIAEFVSGDIPNVAIATILTRLRLRQDVERGQQLYSDTVTVALKGKDKLGWLINNCYLIDSKVQERDFMLRCLGHWNKLSD